jgi:hypothetical protein
MCKSTSSDDVIDQQSSGFFEFMITNAYNCVRLPFYPLDDDDDDANNTSVYLNSTRSPENEDREFLGRIVQLSFMQGSNLD